MSEQEQVESAYKMVKFELSETDEATISEALGTIVADGLEIDWDKVETIDLELDEDCIVEFPDLDELEMIVTGVSISEDSRVYINAVQSEWPQRLKGRVPMVHSFPIGMVEGIKSIAVLNARKKIEAVLIDSIFTFYREEV